MSKAWKIVLAVALASPVFYHYLTLAPAEAHSGKTVVRYMAWGYPAQLKTERELIDLFEAQPENSDVRIEFIMAPMASYYDKLQLMFASGTAPDIVRVNPDHFTSYIGLGFFKDLDPLMQADPSYHPDDYFKVARDRALYKGRHYGIGVLFTTLLCYYNKTIFENAGVDDPWKRFQEGRWSWDDFLETAKQVTLTDASGRPVQFGTVFQANAAGTSRMVQSRGGQLVTPDGRHSLVNTPICVDTVNWINDVVWKWRVSPTPQQAALSVFEFESGKVAMMLDSSGESPRLREAIASFEWDVAPSPGLGGGRIATHDAHILVMNSATKVPDGAWRFMKFMVSEPAERLLGCRLRRCIPTRRGIALSDEYLSADKPPYNMRAFVAGVDDPQPQLPYDEKWAEWIVEWQAHLDECFLRSKPTQQAMDEAVVRIDMILNGETE